jgi:putative ABC transport system permease protein
MHDLWQDLRYCTRICLKRPVFTLTVVITLALGIGANTAIYSIVSSVLLRPLPYRSSSELLLIRHIDKLNGSKMIGPVSYRDFEDWRTRNHVFEDIATFKSNIYRLNAGDDVELVNGCNVSYNFFQLLGVNPLRGRVFLPEEDIRGALNVALISHALWQRVFSADETLVGKQMKLNGEFFTIIGILPPEFKFPIVFGNVEIWSTNSIFSAGMMERGARQFQAIARLKPGVSLNSAQTEMSGILGQLEQEHIATNKNLGLILIPFHKELTKDIELALWLLMGTVGFVLLIACVNVTNLLLARMISRQKELAIRAALGANRWRIMRQLLIEGMLLSVSGGLVSGLVATWIIPVLLAISPRSLPRINEIGMNTHVFGFTLFISVLTGVLICLIPALKVTRPNLVSVLNNSYLASAPKGLRNWSRMFLIIGEVALAMILLIAAGLHINSFIRLIRVELGFNPENVLHTSLNLQLPKYAKDNARVAFIQDICERIKSLPGAPAVGFASRLPFGPDTDTPFEIKGYNRRDANKKLPEARIDTVTPEYFKVMGIPLLKGRQFAETDDKGSKGVAIINEAFAKKFFQYTSPIGQSVTITVNRAEGWPSEFEIVGIIGNVRNVGIDKESKPEIYTPYRQKPVDFGALVIRTNQNARSMVSTIRQQIKTADPEQIFPVVNIFEDKVSGLLKSQRFNTSLLGVFAGIGLLLTLVGIYGVISSLVTESTYEISIRRALGAQNTDILKLVVGRVVVMALIGAIIGIVASFGLTRFMSNMLYGITVTDPMTFIAITCLFVVTTILACYLPARLAMKVDPMNALKSQ